MRLPQVAGEVRTPKHPETLAAIRPKVENIDAHCLCFLTKSPARGSDALEVMHWKANVGIADRVIVSQAANGRKSLV